MHDAVIPASPQEPTPHFMKPPTRIPCLASLLFGALLTALSSAHATPDPVMQIMNFVDDVQECSYVMQNGVLVPTQAPPGTLFPTIRLSRSS